MIFGSKKPTTNNIFQVKKRLITTFSRIAISSSLIVFFAFSMSLVLDEEYKTQAHLLSFESIAQKYYLLDQTGSVELSQYVMAYFDTQSLPESLKQELPYPLDEISRFNPFSEEGILVFHSEFDYQGQRIPLYLTVGTRTIDFGDDSWDLLILVSLLLMFFLIYVLKKSITRMFDGLFRPLTELSNQLTAGKGDEFTISNHSIDELKQLTQELNQYKQMRERVSKQELMFAKYASHELKTPIAIVLGAANLQNMNDDPQFQSKQRQRILGAAESMQMTVEVLLNIVKQENVNVSDEPWLVDTNQITMASFFKHVNEGVAITLDVELGAELNLPAAVLNMLLKNLVQNSIRFTEQGEIKVRISSNSISVEDTGSGLTEVPDTEHGLGLLIVNRLCDTYDWHFELNNHSDMEATDDWQPSGFVQGCCARLIRK